MTATSIASTQTINVYLKLKPDNQVSALIKEFNKFLDDQQIFTTYQITPYLESHPLHVTLYLTTYPKEQIPLIIKQAAALAKQQKQMSLLTSQFVPSDRGYVMLSVTNDAQIQALSNKAMGALAKLRDKKAPIPSWATQDVRRQMIFNQYGSPSVLNYYNPHFSVFSADHLNDYDSARLSRQLRSLINKFVQNHQTELRVTVDAIGVGITDEHGQIVKELKSFPLGS